MCFVIALFLLFPVLPINAQTKHPFTFEDMMALKRVEEPEVSPDGKWVLFAAVDADLKANTKTQACVGGAVNSKPKQQCGGRP